MKMLMLITLCILGLNCILETAVAEPFPPTVSALLLQREQELGNLTFNWNATTQEITPGTSQEHVLELQRDWQQQLPDQLKKQGITDQTAIQRLVKQMVAKVPQIVQSHSRTSVAPFQFRRNGTQMLVTGEVQQTSNLIDYQQFYDQDNGLVVFQVASRNAGKGVPTLSPQAWVHTGGSFRYPCPFPQSLNLSPEHFVALAGFNPLDMYGVQWNLVSQTQTQWVLDGQVKDEHLIPIQVHIVLDRTHDNIIQQLHLEHGRQTADLQVLSYRRYEDEWVGDDVKIVEDIPQVLTRNQTWVLQSIEPSKPIAVALPAHQDVADYRLLGSGYQTHGLFGELTQDQIQNIVYYPWTGVFPSLTELHKLQEQQHPGESSPDPGKSASLPYVGGLMALVGAVWMFRRRGSAV